MMQQYNNNNDNTILVPAENDVLAAGRSNRAKNHPGNMRYRSWINELRDDYVKCDKADKPCYAKAIVTQVKSSNPPGRFLKLDPETGLWSEMEHRKVLVKIRQALREAKGTGESADAAEKEEKDETTEQVDELVSAAMEEDYDVAIGW